MSLFHIKKESICPPVLLKIGKFLEPFQLDEIPFNWNMSFTIETNKRNYSYAVDLTQNIILQVFLKCKEISCTVLQHTSSYTFDALEAIASESNIYGISVIRDAELMTNYIADLRALITKRDGLLARYGYKSWLEYLSNKQTNLEDKYQILCISEIESCPLSRDAQYALFSEIMAFGPRLGIIVFFISSNLEIQINRIKTNKIQLKNESGYIFLKLQINHKNSIANEMIYNKDIVYTPISSEEKKYAITLLRDELKVHSDISPINVVIGTDLNDSNIPFSFRFSKIVDMDNNILKESNHALIAGKTGSGKTTLISRIALAICEKYSPDEVQFFILDYKQGIDFINFGDTPHCPMVFGDANKPELFWQIFDFFIDEYHYRNHIMGTKRFAQFEQYIKEAKKHPDWIQFPRWILIIDEVHAFLSDRLGVNRDLRKKSSDCINTLATLGRSVGIHLILSTQSFRNLDDFARPVKAQFGTRVSMCVSDDLDCQNLFDTTNYQARKLQPLQGVFNDDDFSYSTNQTFKIKRFVDGELIAKLYEIKNKLSQNESRNLHNQYTIKRIKDYFYSNCNCDDLADESGFTKDRNRRVSEFLNKDLS